MRLITVFIFFVRFYVWFIGLFEASLAATSLVKCSQVLYACGVCCNFLMGLFLAHLSHVMRILYLLPSVNSFSKRACAAIQLCQVSDVLLDSSPTSILHVCKH